MHLVKLVPPERLVLLAQPVNLGQLDQLALRDLLVRRVTKAIKAIKVTKEFRV